MIGYKHHFSLLSPQYTATSYHSVQHEIKSSYSLPITHTSALLSQVTCIPFFSPFLFFLRKKKGEKVCVERFIQTSVISFRFLIT